MTNTTLEFAEEGPFLSLIGTPSSLEEEISDWVTRLDERRNHPIGWVLIFDEGRGESVHLTVERYPAAPPLPDPDFDRCVELSVSGRAFLVGGGHDVELTTSDSSETLRVRLARSDGGRSRPRLHVQIWPGPDAPATVMRGAASSEEEVPDLWSLALPEAEAGLAASRRIGADLDCGPGARSISGRRTTVRAELSVPGTPRSLAPLCALARVGTQRTDGRRLSPSSPKRDFPWMYFPVKDEDFPDHILGTSGALGSLTHPESAPPSANIVWWRWARRVPSTNPGPGPSTYARALPWDTVRAVYLAQESTNPALTRVRLEHRDVPVEWVDDLADWWVYQLAILREDAE